MTEDNLKEVYASFARIYGDGKPIRSPLELVAAMRASGLTPETVTDEWLKSLNSDWAYGEALMPFQDPMANRLYQRFLQGH